MTAAYLHLTGAEASIIRPHQSLFRFTADVALEQGHWSPRGGVLGVPDSAGLGVTLDAGAVERMAQRYRSEGAMAAVTTGYRDGFRRW